MSQSRRGEWQTNIRWEETARAVMQAFKPNDAATEAQLKERCLQRLRDGPSIWSDGDMSAYLLTPRCQRTVFRYACADCLAEGDSAMALNSTFGGRLDETLDEQYVGDGRTQARGKRGLSTSVAFQGMEGLGARQPTLSS